MAIMDKLNFTVKAATEKANEAIGNGKLAVRIKKEEYNISEQYKKIGEYFYLKRSEGLDLDPEVDEYCLNIDISKATIAELEEQMKERKTVAEIVPDTPKDTEGVPMFSETPCPNCGAPVTVDAQFCGKCGARLD